MAINIPKKQMTEEDIKLNYITPALQKRGWQDYITMETKVKLTDGEINIKGNKAVRNVPKRADYILYYNETTPIAVVEAKDNNKSASYGLQQAKEYAKALDLMFAYSSNGDKFVEYNFITGKERVYELSEFPTKEDLIGRFECYINGTKVLYLADRNILVDQTISQDFAPLSKVIHKINFQKDDRTTITSYQVYFSLYQQLADRESDNQNNSEEDEESFIRLKSLFDKNYFDLIIVDECHRGSAKEESNWRKILEYFSSATQIGMTATPKETNEVSNIDYFGKPIYTYSLNQGIKDGFLAPLKVYRIKTNIGDSWRPIKEQKDIKGNALTGDELLTFVNNKLFPTLKNLKVNADTPIKKSIVKTTFEDANNYMKDGVLLRQIINIIDELDLQDTEESHAFGEIYESILKELQSAGSAGEFYTPRAVTSFMAKMINPKVGETMADIKVMKMIQHKNWEYARKVA